MFRVFHVSLSGERPCSVFRVFRVSCSGARATEAPIPLDFRRLRRGDGRRLHNFSQLVHLTLRIVLAVRARQDRLGHPP